VRFCGFLLAVGLLGVTAGFGGGAEACFGARLRVGVSGDAAQALASYAAGYYVEEKTGIEPEFVDVAGNPVEALVAEAVDVLLATDQAAPEGVVVRDAGSVPGFGAGRFWVREGVLDDLRFFTVDRALQQLPGFYGSEAFAEASRSRDAPRKAARQAVHRAD